MMYLLAGNRRCNADRLKPYTDVLANIMGSLAVGWASHQVLRSFHLSDYQKHLKADFFCCSRTPASD